LLESDVLPRALALDHRSAELDAPDRAMVDYAVKLTRAPHSVREADVDRLREAGFDDTAILDICQVVSYYNYVNRMAEGLGVELEDGWRPEDLTLTREEFERNVAERGKGR
jgi:uncharacterized peroxidase-related enzyme